MYYDAGGSEKYMAAISAYDDVSSVMEKSVRCAAESVILLNPCTDVFFSIVFDGAIKKYQNSSTCKR